MDTSYIFNYAVDASWAKVVGPPPYNIPEDFPPAANCPEAWNIEITELANNLGYEAGEGGGHLQIQIDVYDWFNAEMNEVVVESLAGIDPLSTSIPIGGGEGYSTYELDLPGEGLTCAGDIDLLITVRSEKIGYQGLLPGENISAYFIHSTHVEDFLPGGQYDWILDDEQMLTDSTHMDRTPSIHQRTTYDIDIGYTRLEEIPDNPDNSRANMHMLTSDDNGEIFTHSWQGSATHFGQTLKSLKVCQGALGYSVFMYQSWLDWGQTPHDHSSLARDPGCPFGENIGIKVPWGAHANEVVICADNIVLCLGDRGGQVMYKKGSHPYSLYHNGLWGGWGDVDDTIIVETGQLGSPRCLVKDASGAIHFAYWGGEGMPWIKMLSNSDGLGTDWDGDVYITEGLTDEYASRIEPSLIIGPDGEFHCTFVGEIDPMYSILYTSSDNGTDWPGYNPIYTSTDAWLGEVTVDAFMQDEETKAIIISFEMEGDIWFIWSLDGGLSFSEPVLVSDGTGNATEPDIRVDAQLYVHFAWAQYEEDLPIVDDWDIHYRRAYLVPEE